MKSTRCWLALLILSVIPPLIRAQTPESPPRQEPRTLEEAAAQRARASEMRSTSDKRLKVEQGECYKKFLVSSCLEEAKERHTQAQIEARRIDIPARDFEREAKRAELAAKEEKRREDESRRAAEQKASAESFREGEAAKSAEREGKIAAKNQKAEAGRAKSAAEEKKRQERKEKRARRDADRAAKKARDSEREAAKAAAKAAPTPP